MDNVLTPNAVEPFFFGKSGRRLYGCCHEPVAGGTSKGIVVLCQTIGQEYIHSHRAFHQLAVRLAAKGLTTLRFDYFGCGDSDGDFEEGSMACWIEDIQFAVEEMQIRTSLQEVSLVGFRVGASLALKAAMSMPDIKKLVLWEMVDNGSKYLEELFLAQKEFNSVLKIKTKYHIGNQDLPTEFLGYTFDLPLIRELKAMELLYSDIPSNCESLTLFNQKTQLPELDISQCGSEGDNSHSVQYIEDHLLWKNQVYKRLIPSITLNAIVAWIERKSAL